MRAHQDQLIKTIFNYEDQHEFVDKLKDALTVETWDGKICAFMAADYVKKIATEVCFFGPLVALYGREVQQLLMAPETPTKISMEEFQESVDMGRRSIKQTVLRSSAKPDYDEEEPVESERRSQASRRIRSPQHDHDQVYEY